MHSAARMQLVRRCTALLACRHSHYSSYEPELFPGLIYRMVQPKIVLLIFVSGKVVLTGGKLRKEIYAAFEQIYPVLQEFRKASTDAQPAARWACHTKRWPSH